MIARSKDTSLQAANIQIALFKKATTAQRIACLRSLSNTVIKLSRRAILRAHPSYTEQELDVAFVAYHYGHKLAARLQACLDRRRL